MLTPLNSIFGESLFDDIFGDFTRPAKNLVRYNAPAPSVMKTDIKESDAGYELEIDLPGYRKENVKAELKEGYLTISAESRQENSLSSQSNWRCSSGPPSQTPPKSPQIIMQSFLVSLDCS